MSYDYLVSKWLIFNVCIICNWKEKHNSPKLVEKDKEVALQLQQLNVKGDFVQTPQINTMPFTQTVETLDNQLAKSSGG